MWRSLSRARHRLKAFWEVVNLRSKQAQGTGEFACTICREKKALAPFEKRVDLHGNIYDLWVCLNCLGILNATHLKLAAVDGRFLALQAESSDEFYAIDDEYLETVPRLIDESAFINFLLSVYPDQPRGVLLDFGAGRGILAGEAAKQFEKVYAADLSLNVLSKVHAAMPLKDKITLTDDFRTIPDRFDSIAAMHVLEHLPNMRDILDALVARLNPGGTLYFQVPMLRNEYLVDVHYTFLNEVSARSLFRALSLDTIGVWFDHDLDFLTCLGRKSPLKTRSL